MIIVYNEIGRIESTMTPKTRTRRVGTQASPRHDENSMVRRSLELGEL